MIRDLDKFNTEIIKRGAKIPATVSDVILMWEKSQGTWYYNCQTGKGSYCVHSVTRNLTANIFLNKRYNAKQFGFWVDNTTDEKGEDILVVRICSFSLGGIKNGEKRYWCNEYVGYIIDKKGNIYSGHYYYTGTEMNTMIDMFSEHSSLVPLNTYIRRSTYTTNILQRFFGTIGFAQGMNSRLFTDDFAIQNIVQYSIPTTPVKKQEKVDFLVNKKLPELIKDSEMKEYILEIIKKRATNKNRKNDEEKYGNIVMNGNCDISIVQRVEEGIAVMRLFTAAINQNNMDLAELKATPTTDDILFFEFGRTYITDKEIISCRNVFGSWLYYKMGQRNGNYRSILMPWTDEEVEGTKMIYFKSIRDLSIEALKHGDEDNESSWYCYSESTDVGMKLHAILESPIFESLMNSGFSNIAKILMSRISWSSPTKLIESVLGPVDVKQKSFLKAAAVPAYMLKEIDKRIGIALLEDGNIWSKAAKESSILPILKKWFVSCPDYISRMDKDTFLKLYDAYMKNDFSTTESECIQNIVKMYGPKNLDLKIYWISKELKKLEHDGYLYWSSRPENIFKDYIQMCVSLGYTNMPWKFRNYADLKRAHDQITEVYNLFKTEQLAKESAEKFEKVHNKWEKLKYETEEFCVIAPESTEQIANEGIELHHCVRSYISAVLSGQTNIMFVRRTDDLNKPFYTLEIKDKRIRQCHGFGNCNIDVVPGLEEFLRKYCEEKNISYTDGHGVLAVGR